MKMKVFILFKSKEIIGTETTNLWYEVESYGITRNKQKKDYNDVSTYPLPLNKEILNNDLEQFMFRSCMEEFHKSK